MHRRFAFAALVIFVAAIVAFGLPLGFVTSHLIRNEIMRDADQQAVTIANVMDQRARAGATLDRGAVDALASATRLVEIQTTDGEPATITRPRPSGPIVWSRRVTTEAGAGVRVGVTGDEISHRTRRVWLVVIALAAAGLVFASVVAVLVARRTSRPFVALADTARRLGHGDFSARAPTTSGIRELDDTAHALNHSAERIGQLVAAERRFTMDASHQLRTPLTALLIRLEEIATTNNLTVAHHEAHAGMRHADQLLESITDLLAAARPQHPDTITALVDVEQLVRDHARLYEPRLRRAERHITIDTSGTTTIRSHPAPIGQAVDVLLDNAVVHGHGHVNIDVEELDAHVRIRVSDQGPTPPHRDNNARHGLLLARTLIGALGGHLTPLTTPHTTYEILLPTNRPTPPSAPATASPVQQAVAAEPPVASGLT